MIRFTDFFFTDCASNTIFAQFKRQLAEYGQIWNFTMFDQIFFRSSCAILVVFPFRATKLVIWNQIGFSLGCWDDGNTCAPIQLTHSNRKCCKLYWKHKQNTKQNCSRTMETAIAFNTYKQYGEYLNQLRRVMVNDWSEK